MPCCAPNIFLCERVRERSCVHGGRAASRFEHLAKAEVTCFGRVLLLFFLQLDSNSLLLLTTNLDHNFNLSAHQLECHRITRTLHFPFTTNHQTLSSASFIQPRLPPMPGPRTKQRAPAQPDTVESLVKPLEQLPVLFSASQHSVASHRKNINTLHALFLRCSAVTTLSDNGKTMRLSGEKLFGEAFRSAVVYPLGAKKGVEQADRVIKFVGGFVGFAVEHGAFKGSVDEILMLRYD